jgi:hypothetical protein
MVRATGSQMMQSRQKAALKEGVGPIFSTPTTIRGCCPLCNQDVHDTQARRKDPTTGLYQHEACFDNAATAKQATAAAAAAVAEAQAEVAAIIAASDAARAEAIGEANRQTAVATAAAAAAAAEAQAEVAAIMSAADAARAEAIGEATRQAQVSVAQAQADAAKIVAAATATAATTTATATATATSTVATTVDGDVDVDVGVGASVSAGDDDSAEAAMSVVCGSTTGSTQPLFPDGKHAFLSYQWDVQAQVVQIKELLDERNVKCWMNADIDGGMGSDKSGRRHSLDSVSIVLLHMTPPPLSLSLSSPCLCLPLCSSP